MKAEEIHNNWLENLQAFKKEYGRGAQKYLSDETGIPHQTITCWLRNRNWPLHPSAVLVNRAMRKWWRQEARK